MVDREKQELSPEEERLCYLLHTQPKPIKVRQIQYYPDGTPFFEIVNREGAVVNFATSEREFYLASHEQDLREGNPLKPPSNIYLDFRNPPDEILDSVGKTMARVPLDIRPDFGAGIPTTGEKIMEKYSKYSHIPILRGLFEKISLPDGGTTLVQADNPPQGHGTSIIILDDVLSKGTNSLPALKIAVNCGFKPVGLLVLIDRQQGGMERLRLEGFPVFFWKNIYEFLGYYLDHPLKELQISQEQYNQAVNSLF